MINFSKFSFKRVKEYFEKNAGKLSILFFLIGFIIDNLTLTRIDSWVDNLLLLSWLSLAFIFILINSIGDYRGFKNKFLYKIYTFAPFVIQFAFGALFSGYVIFYSRASSFFDSWPFLAILYFLFIANEKFRNYYEKFYIQITILYFAIFSFIIFYIPILFKKMNDYIFIFTSFVSLIIIHFILKFFYKYIPNLKKFRKKILRNIISILIIFNIFYFFNLLPPVPLSVKTVEVLHYAGRNADSDYELIKEKRNWYDIYDWYHNVIHWKEGERIYAYASIYAPRNFKTEIKYIWEWYDEEREIWITMGEYPQLIDGGRADGYRSRAYMQNTVKSGDWKLKLVSNKGTVIDKIKFRVEKIDYDILYKSEIIE